MQATQQGLPSSRLRRDLIVLIHLEGEKYASLPTLSALKSALRDLRDVDASIARWFPKHGALIITVPLLLPSKRLREVLIPCLAKAFGGHVSASIRLPIELADIVEAAEALLSDVETQLTATICFADEAAASTVDLHMYDLKQRLLEKLGGPEDILIPLSHYDLLWATAEEASETNRNITEAYGQVVGREVSMTCRSLDCLQDLLGRLAQTGSPTS